MPAEHFYRFNALWTLQRGISGSRSARSRDSGPNADAARPCGENCLTTQDPRFCSHLIVFQLYRHFIHLPVSVSREFLQP
jgi:hypothetical protein